MVTTAISHIAHLAQLCVKHGVKRVVVSPGSRNAPLVIAFDIQPEIEIFLVHDERSAAFFAMGMAEATGEPVAITCTSGSAPLNYAPAIAEAYYRRIPLLVLTADRPVDMVDQGDGQTIRQKNVFSNIIKAQFELPDFPFGSEVKVSDQIVNSALAALVQVPHGPVHINIPLTEPLYEMLELETEPNYVEVIQEQAKLSQEDKATIERVWQKSEKKLLLIGQLNPGEISLEQLRPILNDPSVAVLVENTSNIRNFQRICHCIDRTLATISEDEIDDFAPDLLITMGGAIISKKIKAFFRANKPNNNWRIGRYLFEEDTYQSLTHSFHVSPGEFLRHITNIEMTSSSNFGGKWKQRDFLSRDIHDQYLAETDFSDLKAFQLIWSALPEGSNLHMSNSSVVRYGQLYDPVENINYYCNRGVSGIDGSTSTALGIASQTKDKLNVLITGDISFFYDSNGLWNNYLGANFKIIVISNGGGGIFKIIDGPGSSDQLDYFVAPHQGNVKGICEAFNVNYSSVNGSAELEEALESFFYSETDRPVVMEINTAEVENEKVLKQYFKRIGKSFKI